LVINNYEAGIRSRAVLLPRLYQHKTAIRNLMKTISLCLFFPWTLVLTLSAQNGQKADNLFLKNQTAQDEQRYAVNLPDYHETSPSDHPVSNLLFCEDRNQTESINRGGDRPVPDNNKTGGFVNEVNSSLVDRDYINSSMNEVHGSQIIPDGLQKEDEFGSFTVTNQNILLDITVVRTGITLNRISNNTTGFNYLTEPSPLFEFKGEDSTICRSNKGVIIEQVTLSEDSSVLCIYGRIKEIPLAFDFTFTSSEPDPCILIDMNIVNFGTDSLIIRAIVPRLYGLVTSGLKGDMWASVPQEIGTVVPLAKLSPSIGMTCNQRIGLPNAMNTMELVSIYDQRGGGGVFFADVKGDLDNNIAPIQFTLSSDTVSGFWVTKLAPKESASLPTFAIGVHNSGDWHHAVDYYIKKHRQHWAFPEIPEWLRDQGAIYGFSGGGGGGSYLLYPAQTLKNRISSFEELPKLLGEAKQLGTNIVYIWDYWERAAEGGKPAYWNKGDYVPRSDLGGDSAFINGIRYVHEQGGKIIVYVEPFIIFDYSQIGKDNGNLWGGRIPDGNLYRHYLGCYTMVAPFRLWQDYLVGVAEKLVRDYDVDGIFLDSWAWQMNWPMLNNAEQVLYYPKEYSQGVLTLTDRIREAIQAIKPDAVVIGETTSGPISRHWHGGLSADFAWLATQNQGRIIASPVRYGMPEVNFYSNGHNVNELNQIYAAGHSLALANKDLLMAPYINNLVSIRQKYKDALIYGSQQYQPSTGDVNVAAYFYRGEHHNVLIVVNTSEELTYSGRLMLNENKTISRWRDLMTDNEFEASRGMLYLEIPPKELRILLYEGSVNHITIEKDSENPE